MKRLLPLLVVGIFVLSGLGAVTGTEVEIENFISENISFSQPIISEKEDYVTIELAESSCVSMETDMPSLPVVTKVYTFPFGTKIDDVKVTFSNILEKEITKPIEPAPESLPVSIYSTNIVEEPDEIVTYSDIDVYPTERYGWKVASGLDNGEHVVYLSVPMFVDQYYPNENKILHAENAKIEVSYTPPTDPFIFGDTYDYLIITPSQFTSALQRLVDHKNNDLDPPIRTKMVTLDQIPSGVGVDEQEDIKYYIKDAIETWGITYCLLVGAGVEGEELFPVRYAWISDDREQNFPSDLYYADVYDGEGGFPNWDKDGDGRYGEYPRDKDNMDIIPDVYLGKLPATSTSEINIYIDKVIYYKEHNKMTKKIAQAGGDTFPGNSQVEGEAANIAVMNKLSGYTAYQYWSSNTGADDTITKENLAAGWNQNVDFVDWSGHGNEVGWATHPKNDDDTWLPPATTISPFDLFLTVDFDLYLVRNSKKFPVVFYNACSCNKYTEEAQNLGWKTLNKRNGGGVIVYAASGIGYGVPGNEVSRRFGWMEVHCFDELIQTKIVGEVWHNCIRDYYTTFDSNFEKLDYKTMVEFSMFGDPTLIVQDGDDPQSRSVNNPIFSSILERLANTFPRLAQIIEVIIARLN